MTTEEFIKRAKEVHGNKYDYSKVEYKNMHSKICIICPEHGEFWQIAGNHLRGRGCIKCKMPKRKILTNDLFIQKAREVHGDKYDYSKVECDKVTIKVCIICPEHGEFWQAANAHLKGAGCPKCANNVKITKKEFIQKAKEVHGDKYDYSKVVYKGPKEKVCIICPEHGEFWQQPSKHIGGQGCTKCNDEVKNNIKKEKFIQKAREVHGDKYDYSKVVYKGIKEKVCIVCPEHGEFWQSIGKHLFGQGCIKCKQPNAGLNQNEFIKRAREVHGDKYDYSKVEYKDLYTPVTIICPEHGEFSQGPRQHLNGRGCPNCYGVRKAYKFDLLKEFESEYELRAFLENNDPNILLAILNNICETDPKFNPIKKDVEKALENSEKEDPISKLEEKYSSNSVDDEVEEEEDIPDKIDLDDEDQFDKIIGKFDEVDEEKELTIEDAIKNTEKEIKIINKIDHLIAPELRKKIMRKLLNDKLRQFMELNS